MTMRNLDALITPRSVVLLGASERPGSVGAVLARKLTEGAFAGPVHLISPKGGTIAGRPVLTRPAELPEPADLAVIATPPETIPGLIAELGAAGTRAAIVVSAGFGEAGEAGLALQGRMLEAARPHLLRILGPNCIGALLPRIGLDASFAHLMSKPGNIALVAQSGAVLTAMLDWAAARDIGFSHALSMGGMADVDLGDMLDYLAGDGSVRAVLLYVEGIADARKFMSAARRASRAKPVVVIKAGRHPPGVRAARSHTGALAGSFAIYEAAFHRAGLLHVDSLEALFDAAETLASGLRVRGNRLAIVTNGGGVGVLATDRLVEEGGEPAELAPATMTALGAVLPQGRPLGLPVDLLGDAGPERYRAVVAAVRADPNVDAVLAINCPVAIADSTAAAEAVADAAGGPGAPVIACWLGTTQADTARRAFARSRVPVFGLPDDAVRAFMRLDRHRRQRDLLRTAPAALHLPATDAARAAAPLDAALAEGRGDLAEAEARAVLAAHGIPSAPPGADLPDDAWAAVVGMIDDPTFGPTISFGEGGAAAELIGDQALALVPLDAVAARDLVERTRLYRRLAGFGDRPPVDFDALIAALVGIARMAVLHPQLAWLEINPLQVDGRGVLVHGVRIRVAPPPRPGDGRLAIKPYPTELVHSVVTERGDTVLLRPIRPEDEPALQAMIEASDRGDLRRRFFSAMRRAPDALIARLTQLDFDREIGFVVEAEGALLAHGGLICDPDRAEGEYAVLVRSDRQGEGLGRLMMETLIGQGRAWRLQRIVGDVLAENSGMLHLCAELGFRLETDPRDRTIVRVTLTL